jgi:hypothetical protein
VVWSNHIAYFDESGDHGLQNIDADFPIFVLCGCLFRKDDYRRHDLPAFSQLKFEYFGHDAVVFHSRDIRKQIGAFQVLMDARFRTSFMDAIATFYRQSSCTLIAAAIRKDAHKTRYATPDDPYEISLLFCLERLYACLKDRNDHRGTTVCVFEKRGDKEDNKLAAEFERICAGANRWGALPFRIVFASKQTNMAGLQVADLAAYPIARKILAPAKPNASYDALSHLIRRSPEGKSDGWGLKVFP